MAIERAKLLYFYWTSVLALTPVLEVSVSVKSDSGLEAKS